MIRRYPKRRQMRNVGKLKDLQRQGRFIISDRVFDAIPRYPFPVYPFLDPFRVIISLFASRLQPLTSASVFPKSDHI